MRVSQFFLSTLREAPADAEIVSHKLMLRAGIIRRLAGGIYTWMPLGLRIVRKHLGYAHIPQHFAAQVNLFCQDFLNPYVNFHRPCFFPETTTDRKGKIRKRYLLKNMMTPYEKLKSRPKAKQFLKPGITFAQLDILATAISDNEAVRRLNEARTQLFQSIQHRSKHAA